MMPGQTPYRSIRYPLATEVADPAAMQLLAADIDAALQYVQQVLTWSQTRSYAIGSAAPNLAKTTTANFNLTVNTDRGTQGPGGAPYWAAGLPTRLTAPATGLYMAWGTFTNGTLPSAGTSVVRAQIQKNGANPVTSSQGGRNGPPIASLIQMWQLNAGEYLQFGGWWNGTPAGPLVMDVTWGIAMIAVGP